MVNTFPSLLVKWNKFKKSAAFFSRDTTTLAFFGTSGISIDVEAPRISSSCWTKE